MQRGAQAVAQAALVIDGDDDLPKVCYIELMNEHSFGILSGRTADGGRGRQRSQECSRLRQQIR